MKQFTKYLHIVNLFGALFLASTAILASFSVYKIGVSIFFVSYFVEIFVDKKWKSIAFDKKSLYYFVMLFFFLLALIYYPFDSSHYFKGLLEYRYPLLGFGIVGILGLNERYKLNYFLNTLIISSVIVILYLIFVEVGVKEFFVESNRNFLFTEARRLHVNQHMMFNFYLNLSLISIWYILTRSWKRIIKWKRYLYIAALCLIFFILSITEGRSGFLAGLLLMAGFLFFEIWRRRKVIGLAVALVAPFLLVLIASGHERLTKDMIANEARLFLWEATLPVIKENPVLGVGISRAQQAYDISRSEYETPEFHHVWFEIEKVSRIDSHSQYLQTTMEFGVFGLLFLLFIYIFPYFIVEKRRQLFSFFILCLCAYQSIFDIFLTGQFATIFCVLMLLILSVENNIALEKPKQKREKSYFIHTKCLI